MERPVVISILTLNNLPLLKQCLESIFENTIIPCRVCVVNQASTDSTREYLERMGDHLDVINSPENLGFIGGNNLVMERYSDSDIVLLNNDTIVRRGWLKALRNCAYSDPQIGIVGAKLLYPDGRLQEAGGEIFQDGSGRNIGKNDDPNRYIYNVRRDVDYCSGACLFVKREILDRIGYLDEIFSPAYWEDTDLCFRARKSGYRVVYEPEAEVIHLEGATSGSPSLDSLSRSLQQRNKPKFMARWGEELKNHRKNVFEVRASTGKDKILVILPFLPMYDRAAGEKRWFHNLQILKKHFDVVFLARNGMNQLNYINELERMGITVFHTDQARLKQMGCDIEGPLWIDLPMLLKSNDFKGIIIGFHHVAHQYYRATRTYSPQSVLIIDSYDLSFLRERRKADLSGDCREAWKALEIKRQELAMYRKGDMVLTVTEEDRRRLLEEAPELHVGISTDVHPLGEGNRPDQIQDLVFVGNYKHDPNEDAVLYFLDEILPKIKADLPHLKIYIVGNSPTAKIKALAADDIIVTGFVPEVAPYLYKSKVFIAPLRYGAGLKGKIGEALACGIPIVTTSIGAEGMNLVHRKNAMIADDPDEFARCVIELYTDDELWQKLSSEGKLLAKQNYSYEAAERHWEETINSIRQGRPVEYKLPDQARLRGFKKLSPVPDIVPDVSIVVPVYNNLDVTRSCWSSIRKNTRIPFQLVIIDNGSTDDVAYEADQNNLNIIRNDSNKGFAYACNQGIRSTHGDFIVVLNNDTVVTPGWLERLLWHMTNDDEVGIVGPSTNFAATIQQIGVTYKSEKDLYDFSEQVYCKNRHASAELQKIVGVCMVLRRKMLEEIGVFDTRFGLGNYEDDDLCLRARIAGYKVLWAKDVFVHHRGSKTFQAIDVDYARLLEENRQKYVSKWMPVIQEISAIDSAPSTSVADHGSTWPVVVLDDGSGNLGETIEALKAYSPRSKIIVIGGDKGHWDESRVVLLGEGRDIGISTCIDEFVKQYHGDNIFFVRTGAVVTPGWDGPLQAALLADKVGCALPASNQGWGNQLTKATCRKLGKSLVRFARKNALEWQGRIEEIPMGFPVAMAIRKGVLLQRGLAHEFVSDALLLDLQRRLSDSGLRVVCAKDSYVHAVGKPSKEWESEKRAVVSLLSARECLEEQAIDAALQHLDEALCAKPDYTEGLYERGLLYALKGLDERAMQDFDKLIEIMPSDSRAYNNLGCLHFSHNRVDEAEKLFLRAVELDPCNWEAKKNLADLYMKIGRGKSAVDLYSSIIEEHSGCPEIYVSLGELLAAYGDLDGAEQLFKVALRLAPDDKGAEKGLGAIQLAKAKLCTTGGGIVDTKSDKTLCLHDRQG